MISKRAPRERILMYIEANKDLFRVSKRQRQKAEERIAMMDRGIEPNEPGKVDYLIGHYAWLYRHVREGNTQKAKAKLDFLDLFVNSNKPRFILDELGKEPDPYMKDVLSETGKAVKAYEAEDFATAKGHFFKAVQLLQELING
jgi:hypothetical protein